MGLEVSITGAATFSKVAAQIRAEGNKDLSRAMGRALEKVTRPVTQSITAEAGRAMPSGYRSLLTGSLRHRASRRNAGQQAQLIIRTYADGKKERRDLPSLEEGELRHPLFGRKKVWYVTSITPGFHRRGTELAADEAESAMNKVVQDFAARLIK
jgi:hypothetical protein